MKVQATTVETAVFNNNLQVGQAYKALINVPEDYSFPRTNEVFVDIVSELHPDRVVFGYWNPETKCFEGGHIWGPEGVAAGEIEFYTID